MNKTIIIYAGKSCPFSKRLRDDLDAAHIAYELKIVEHDEKACIEMYELTKKPWTPVTKITIDRKDSIILGYNKEKKKQIEELLHLTLEHKRAII